MEISIGNDTQRRVNDHLKFSENISDFESNGQTARLNSGTTMVGTRDAFAPKKSLLIHIFPM